MFNLQGSELIIILLLALVVLGPEKLPEAMRKAGNFYAELKKMSAGFQEEFRAAVQEPVQEMRDTASMLRDSADFTKFQAGERAEKPKSAEMVTPADQAETPADVVPFGDPQTDADSDAESDAVDAASDDASEPAAPKTPDPEKPAKPAQRWSFDLPRSDEAPASDDEVGDG